MAVMCAFSTVMAKLPELSDEAKAKAAEAAAKSSWAGKVDNYLLCKSQDKAAASYYKTAKATGKDAKPAICLVRPLRRSICLRCMRAARRPAFFDFNPAWLFSSGSSKILT